MTWWQLLLLVSISIVALVIMVIAGMYLSLRMFLAIFLTDENYTKWIKVTNKLKKLMRIKGIKIDEKVEDEPNGGY